MSDAEWLVYVGRALINDGVWNDALGKLAEATQTNALGRRSICLRRSGASERAIQ